MRVQVQKWGNSLALQIPKPLAEDMGVQAGTAVQLAVSAGRLVAAPIRPRKTRLKDLLAKVTKTNLHAEVWAHPPLEKEASAGPSLCSG